MKRVLTFLAAASGLSIALSAAADAQTLGGFPIREPGATRPSPGDGSGAGPGASSRNEVVVSQDAGSRVTTIAQAMRFVRPGGTGRGGASPPPGQSFRRLRAPPGASRGRSAASEERKPSNTSIGNPFG